MGALPVLSDPAYFIEAELGSGGGSNVYKAWHSRLQKYVVLKRIKDESGLIQSGLQRAEVDILKNLKHACLPQLYDFLDDPGGVYTVIEFIPGLSFADLLNEGRRFAQRDVIRWAEQLSGALAYLHGQNPTVLHSDIKPANVMLTQEGEVCLIDFNISLVLDSGDVKALGVSHGYAPPEQYGLHISFPETTSGVGVPHRRGKEPAGSVLSSDVTQLDSQFYGSATTELSTGNTTDLRPVQQGAYAASARSVPPVRQNEGIRIDERSDIYSFGATLCHLLTGERPEAATGNVKRLGEYRGIALSEAFTYIIERCMERDPAKRFQSATDLHDAIVNIHSLDRRWKRQRAKGIIAAVVLSVCLTGFSAAAFLGRQLMSSEKQEAYNRFILGIASDSGDSAYNEAVSLFPERPDAYREQAVKLYVSGSLYDCIEYVKGAMAKLSAYPHDADALRIIGDIFYTQATAYFDSEQFADSLSSYEAAVGNNPYSPDIYRDYAIALARCGHIDEAEELLSGFSSFNPGGDSIDLLKGEIAFARGDYKQAVSLFEAVIAKTDDPHIKSQAYLVCVSAYRREPEQVHSEIAFIRKALLDLPDSYGLLLKERLADALTRAGEYDEAAALYEELRLSGNISYNTWQNIGQLYQQTGDYARARAVYTELTQAYPGDYRPPLRLAFLTLEEQALLGSEARDYKESYEWYATALELYEKRPGAGDDMEMLMLGNLIAELRQNGWID